MLQAQVELPISVGVLEPFPECANLKRGNELEIAVHSERRRRPRAELHWAVRIVRHPGQEPVECVTGNLSTEGFYCLCDGSSFVPGEFVECTIRIPTQSRNGDGSFRLQCLVQVVRVDGRSGIGCHIESYRVLPPPDSPEGR